MVAGQAHFQDDAYMKAAFDGIDADGSGEISLDEVIKVLGTDGSSELSTDLRGWDTDGSGAIGFEEFKQLMKAAVPPPPEESLAAESF